MAFISSAFTAGQTLTAASMEDLRGNANAGHSVFTNEAARDAAITAPTEGLMAYLTAPTVPAATGGSTAVPTGVVTIYNGSAWVCVTPVSASTPDSGTRASTSYGALTGGGTNPTVTITTGTTALVMLSSWIGVGSNVGGYVSFAVSGATTLASSDNNMASLYQFGASNVEAQMSRSLIVTGLTAGSNTFTLEYKCNTASSITFQRRSLTVQGIA